MSTNNESGASLPIIDLSLLAGTDQQRQQLAQSLADACLHTGFFYVSHHGISEALIKRVFEESQALFSLPDADKEAINKMFTPEFRNRLDSIIGFASLSPEVVAKVVDKFIMELEAQLDEPSLVALVKRFESGAYAGRDVMALIVAGLRGGGWQGSAKDLLTAEIAGGPVGAAQVAATLLARAFTPPA